MPETPRTRWSAKSGTGWSAKSQSGWSAKSQTGWFFKVMPARRALYVKTPASPEHMLVRRVLLVEILLARASWLYRFAR